MRRFALVGAASVLAAGMLTVGTGSPAWAGHPVHPDSFCVFTTNQSTPVYSSPNTGSSKLYTVAAGQNVSAVDTAISGPGGPFYKGGVVGRAQGYMQVSHLGNKRSCAM